MVLNGWKRLSQGWLEKRKVGLHKLKKAEEDLQKARTKTLLKEAGLILPGKVYQIHQKHTYNIVQGRAHKELID